ncbi:hypothetical protein BJ508DRAFT_373189 [Ascobolus immersus RN42]|uniref:Uncharacterized protein n=1 Tax=Ascobolus immersus RN42 TaxID=1160509 RepID=A0A3N4IMT0_ASCIM|nr:hypothetical protein BJ508DRAFT_373189 [Ascobolus immersus RN42]
MTPISHLLRTASASGVKSQGQKSAAAPLFLASVVAAGAITQHRHSSASAAPTTTSRDFMMVPEWVRKAFHSLPKLDTDEPTPYRPPQNLTEDPTIINDPNLNDTNPELRADDDDWHAAGEELSDEAWQEGGMNAEEEAEEIARVFKERSKRVENGDALPPSWK